MPANRKPRRSHKQWKQLIEQYHAGTEGTVQFCTRHNLGSTTFKKWRRHYSGITHPASGLIELTPPEQPPANPWDIELSLGKAIILRIRSH